MGAVCSRVGMCVGEDKGEWRSRVEELVGDTDAIFYVFPWSFGYTIFRRGSVAKRRNLGLERS